MKRLILLALLISMPMAASAETKAQRLVNELLTVTNAAAMIDQMQLQVREAMRQGMQQSGLDLANLSPKERVIIERGMDDLTAVFGEMLNWENMRPYMVSLYTQVFTEEELQAQVDFYKTDAGQAVTAKMPQVLSESLVYGQRMMEQAMPRVMEISNTMERELAALER